MRFGVKIPNDSGPTRESIRRTVLAAEQLGFDSVWIDAHVVVPTPIFSRYPLAEDGLPTFNTESPFADPFVTLAFAAGCTARIRLGTAVVPLLATHPLALAKQAVTLDVVSGGRAEVGLGAGWLLEEAVALERPTKHRTGRLDEAIDLLRTAWRDGTFEWRGRYFNVGRVGIYPQPPQRDHLPLWIGGTGPAAIRIVARTGAGLLISRANAPRVAEYRAQLTAAGGHDARLGASFSLGEDRQQAAAAAQALHRAGADLVMIGGRWDQGEQVERLRWFANEVVPTL
jgi:probable F420-dependent oxidoreductase